jgi:exonuclease VII small subunit
MPLDNQTDPALRGLTELPPDLAEFRDVRAPSEMIQLGRTVALATARHEDLLKFRRTWGGAFEDPDLAADAAVKPIDRAAIYPTSHILHFSVLASLVLFEGLANAYFFSAGSDLGLLGGWLQAITVSFTNVIAAFFLVGFLGLRHMSNPRKPVTAALAGIGALFGVFTLIVLNLSAAHFRDLLELNAASLALGAGDVTGLVLAPVSAALSDPFGIETLEALLLLVLGVTFAVIAAFKGRTFDDAIPGYGGVTRRLETAAAALEKALESGWKDAKKLSQHELEKLVDAKDLLDEICRDLAGPTNRR